MAQDNASLGGFRWINPELVEQMRKETILKTFRALNQYSGREITLERLSELLGLNFYEVNNLIRGHPLHRDKGGS